MRSIWLMSITSETSAMFSARDASCRIRRPSSPSPWNEYGELRGLNAPPRSTFAPARRTAVAAAITCCSLSSEQGPAMTTTSSPPMRTSPTTTTVGSDLNVRLASLYGEEIRTTSWTPSIISMSAASGRPCPTAPRTVLVTPVDLWTSIPISTRRFTTCSIWLSVAPSCITTTMTCCSLFLQCRRHLAALVGFAVDHAPFQPARLVDDALEQPRDGVGPERPLGGNRAHVLQHLLLAIGLVDLHPGFLL